MEIELHFVGPDPESAKVGFVFEDVGAASDFIRDTHPENDDCKTYRGTFVLNGDGLSEVEQC